MSKPGEWRRVARLGRVWDSVPSEWKNTMTLEVDESFDFFDGSTWTPANDNHSPHTGILSVAPTKSAPSTHSSASATLTIMGGHMETRKQHQENEGLLGDSFSVASGGHPLPADDYLDEEREEHPFETSTMSGFFQANTVVRLEPEPEPEPESWPTPEPELALSPEPQPWFMSQPWFVPQPWLVPELDYQDDAPTSARHIRALITNLLESPDDALVQRWTGIVRECVLPGDSGGYPHPAPSEQHSEAVMEEVCSDDGYSRPPSEQPPELLEEVWDHGDMVYRQPPTEHSEIMEERPSVDFRFPRTPRGNPGHVEEVRSCKSA